MAELKPCPFCGGNRTKADFKRKHVRYNGFGNYLEWCSASVRCTRCYARGSIVSGDVFHGILHDGERMPEGSTTEDALRKGAIEAWNSRACDAVEVVRCKNCAVPHNKWTGCPKLNGLIPPPDFYCAYGERKKENESNA